MKCRLNDIGAHIRIELLETMRADMGQSGISDKRAVKWQMTENVRFRRLRCGHFWGVNDTMTTQFKLCGVTEKTLLKLYMETQRVVYSYWDAAQIEPKSDD